VATQRLTIFLLRDVKTADDAIEPGLLKALQRRSLGSSSLDGAFYSSISHVNRPSWASYVDPLVSGGRLDNLKSASASGLLIIKAESNFFALTFGYGRSMLDLSKIERRFGLKVALNVIDGNRIRSMDTKTFDDLVVSRNTQTSRTSALPTFGVDILKDILRAVTGIAPEGSPFKSLSGSDALVLSTTAKPTELSSLLKTLLGHYKETKYKSQFGWVDHLAEVRDLGTIAALETQLIAELSVQDTVSAHMAMPENLEWEDIDFFNIQPNRDLIYEELDLDAYLAQDSTDAAHLTIDQLKTRKVKVKFASASTAIGRWTIYQCLVAEHRLNGSLYALVEGRWFSVAKSLVEEVDKAIAAIPSSSIALPTSKAGESEGDYNARAAATSNELTLLDKNLVAPAGATTKLEFCDLMGSDGSLIHVKRKTRSSTLSHLFAQGEVSARALVDGELRNQVRKAIKKSRGDEDATPWLSSVPPSSGTFTRDKLTITYAIIADSKAGGVDWLPFFSRLNLMQTTRSLVTLGYNVHLLRIPVS